MLKDSRFQVYICVGPIRDKIIENLHHYSVGSMTLCRTKGAVRKKPAPLFYISIWAYSTYKVIQSGQLRQCGLTVPVTSTIQNWYIDQLLLYIYFYIAQLEQLSVLTNPIP